jgi:hypothetical protein
MENDNNVQKKLFRQSSLERISSPEELNDYVRVANPGVWMILAAIVILLIGFCVWGVLGELETTVSGVLITNDDGTCCFVAEEDITKIKSGMVIRCNDEEYTVNEISGSSMDANSALTDYAMHVGGFTEGQWIHAISINEESAVEGTFPASIIIESVKPISFILN